MTTRLLAALALVAAFAAAPLPAQTTPWFGLTLPPKSGDVPAVLVGARAPRPVVVPPGDPAAPELAGAALEAEVDTIVGFSKESRATKEMGTNQMWGRVSGFPSELKTVRWAADQFRKAGIADVRLQPIQQDARSSFWMPTSWELRLLGDAAFGAGSGDVVLTSALPLSPSSIPGGTMTAPLVYVGTANPSVVEHIDVRGAIAVQAVIPQGHMVFERGAVDDRSEALVKKGAVGVVNLVRLPGNEASRDFSNCGNPCFNVGGRDGWFLEQVFDRAAQAGVGGKLRARISLVTETKTGLSAENAVAVIPGRRPGAGAIVLNAHVDAWFDGAGDNADGLAVLVGLARHFARPEHQLSRTLVLVASAGHHTPGINGPRGFIQANPDLAKAAVMLVNIEHVAQRNFSPARTTAPDGYREAVADSGEAPISVGVTNDSPFVQAILDRGPSTYGVNFVSERSTFLSGETGGWASLAAAKVTIMQAPPLYHTTGEVQAVISAPGLERMARFIADLTRRVDAADAAQINPPTASRAP